MTTTDESPRNQRWAMVDGRRVEILCGVAEMPERLIRGKTVTWVERELVRELRLMAPAPVRPAVAAE